MQCFNGDICTGFAVIPKTASFIQSRQDNLEVMFLKYKDYTRSPQYGKIYSYNEAGKQVHELDILNLELTHEDKDYTIAELLQMVVDHSAEEKKIQADLRAKTVLIDGLSRTVSQLQAKNDLLVKAITKLTAEVSRIKSTNKGI